MKILKSIIGVVIAFVVFIVLAGIFERLFAILDKIAGQDFLLQEIWSILLAAILGTYLGMKCIPLLFLDYSKRLIIFLFSLIMVIFLFVSLYYMIPTAKALGFGVKEFAVNMLTPIAAIVTAYASLPDSFTDQNSKVDDYGITDEDFE